MKTFKQHLKEVTTVNYGSTHPAHQDSIEDGSMGAHNIQDPKILERVNAYVESIAAGEYMNPQAAIEQLTNKLKAIGLSVSPVQMDGGNGTVTTEINQFGGRFGKDLDGSDINDDGISHKKEGGLKLQVKYEKLDTGATKVYAKLI